MAIADYKSAVVTGASSGIGEAVVRALSAQGLEVRAVARRAERLQKLAAETGCTVHVLDLRDTDALYATLQAVEADVLINNAGMGRGFDTLFQASREDVEQTIGTNVTAAIHLVRALAPGMIARKRGHIVNTGSVAGLYPLLSSLYGASKGAIHVFSQNLRLELQASAVRCTEICPARVRTEFFEVALQDKNRAEEGYAGFEVLEPQDIAAAIVYALDAPWRVNVSTIEVAPTEQCIGGTRIVPVDSG